MARKTNRTSTTTSSFGVGRRESHDSSPFYARFVAPETTTDENVVRWEAPDPFILGDSAHMDEVPDDSVALVVTSPPYFVGKEYEQALGEGHVPETYLDYLDMLLRVFRECKKKLEPGGRMAINVANLGRKPYRSLSSDVIRILQDDLGLLLRGEVIWLKSRGSNGSCAWGSFRRPSNPTLRDTTERVIIASKGRFDRAIPTRKRLQQGLPSHSTVTTDEFMDATLDVWEIPPERASRVGHPAPFPVELPRRLIELYTYEDDLVLDPFMGSGSALLAAAQAGRRYVGYDIDEQYVALARQRVPRAAVPRAGTAPHAPASEPEDGMGFLQEMDPSKTGSRAQDVCDGKRIQIVVGLLLRECGFEIISENRLLQRLGLTVNYVARDKAGCEWYFDVTGAFTILRGGLRKSDTLMKCLGRALVLQSVRKARIVLLTTDLPQPGSPGHLSLRAAGPSTVFDAIEIQSSAGKARLMEYAAGRRDKPLPGFWTDSDINRSGSSD